MRFGVCPSRAARGGENPSRFSPDLWRVAAYDKIDDADVDGFASEVTRASRQATLTSEYSYTPAPYTAPLHFYCREDYVLYWLLRFSARAVFTSSAEYTTIRGWAAGNTSAAVYWQRYYVGGVDCQRKLTGVDLADVCSGNHDKANPFITNTSYVVGLDVGRLFYQLNLTRVLGVDESSLDLDDENLRK